MWHLQHSVSIWIPVRKKRNQIKMHIQIIVMVELSVDKQINITISCCWLKPHLFGCFLKVNWHFRNKKFYCWGFSWSKTNLIYYHHHHHHHHHHDHYYYYHFHHYHHNFFFFFRQNMYYVSLSATLPLDNENVNT